MGHTAGASTWASDANAWMEGVQRLQNPTGAGCSGDAGAAPATRAAGPLSDKRTTANLCANTDDCWWLVKVRLFI
jgi:hypothetical protein